MEDLLFVAKFPLADRAQRFAVRIAEPGWWASNVRQNGRTVTWTATIPKGAETTPQEYESDMRGTVGYYGSDDSRKATLNGVKAPVSY